MQKRPQIGCSPKGLFHMVKRPSHVLFIFQRVNEARPSGVYNSPLAPKGMGGGGVCLTDVMHAHDSQGFSLQLMKGRDLPLFPVDTGAQIGKISPQCTKRGSMEEGFHGS